MKKSRYNLSLRSIAFLLVLTFLSSDLAHAAPALSFVPRDLAHDPGRLQISSEIAKVSQTYKGDGRGGVPPPLLIHIQDAHTNVSTQSSIARILEELIRKYHLKTIFVEGGTKNDSLTFLRPLASREIREQVAKKYLLRGELKGPEYLNLASDYDMELWGVEDPALYEKNLKNYAHIVEKREAILAYLDEIQIRVQSLKRRYYPKKILAFDDFLGKFEAKEKDFTEYFSLLSQYASQAGINLLGYPYFFSLQELKVKEDKIDFKKANEELTVIARRSPQATDEAISERYEIASPRPRFLLSQESSGGHVRNDVYTAKLKSHSSVPLNFYTALLSEAKKNGLHPNDFQNLSSYVDYLKCYSKIDLERLTEETRTLQQEIFDVSLRGANGAEAISDAQYIKEISDYIKNLKTLFSLRVSKSDYEAYFAKKGDNRFETVVMLAFLNRKLYDLGNYADVLKYLPLIEDNKKDVESFYEINAKRDEVFLEKALKKMTAENISVAVLITGGYHTPNLSELMKKRGVSYAVITPAIEQETNVKRYEEILLGQLDRKNRHSEEVAAATDEESQNEILRRSPQDDGISIKTFAERMITERNDGARLVAVEQDLLTWMPTGNENRNPRMSIGGDHPNVFESLRAWASAVAKQSQLIILNAVRNLQPAFGARMTNHYPVLLMKTHDFWTAVTNEGTQNFRPILATTNTNSRYLEQYKILLKGIFGNNPDSINQIIDSIKNSDSLQQTVFILSENDDVAGGYTFVPLNRKPLRGYLHTIVVDRSKYKGTGAVDVLLEDLKERFVGSEGIFMAINTRNSERVTEISPMGTVDDYKKSAGILSITTVLDLNKSAARLSKKQELTDLRNTIREYLVFLKNQNILEPMDIGQFDGQFFKNSGEMADFLEELWRQIELSDIWTSPRGNPDSPAKQKAIKVLKSIAAFIRQGDLKRVSEIDIDSNSSNAGPQGSSAARMSVVQELAQDKYRIKVINGRIDLTAVPQGVNWVMDQIRPVEGGAIIENFNQMPVITLTTPTEEIDGLPIISKFGMNQQGIFLGMADINGNRQPVVVKKFWFGGEGCLNEYIAMQVYEKLGIGPRFYGVIKDSRGQIVGYAMQLILGRYIKMEDVEEGVTDELRFHALLESIAEFLPPLIDTSKMNGVWREQLIADREEIRMRVFAAGLIGTTDEAFHTTIHRLVAIDPVNRWGIRDTSQFRAFVEANREERIRLIENARADYFLWTHFPTALTQLLGPQNNSEVSLGSDHLVSISFKLDMGGDLGDKDIVSALGLKGSVRFTADDHKWSGSDPNLPDLSLKNLRVVRQQGYYLLSAEFEPPASADYMKFTINLSDKWNRSNWFKNGTPDNNWTLKIKSAARMAGLPVNVFPVSYVSNENIGAFPIKYDPVVAHLEAVNPAFFAFYGVGIMQGIRAGAVIFSDDKSLDFSGEFSELFVRLLREAVADHLMPRRLSISDDDTRPLFRDRSNLRQNTGLAYSMDSNRSRNAPSSINHPLVLSPLLLFLSATILTNPRSIFSGWFRNSDILAIFSLMIISENVILFLAPSKSKYNTPIFRLLQEPSNRRISAARLAIKAPASRPPRFVGGRLAMAVDNLKQPARSQKPPRDLPQFEVPIPYLQRVWGQRFDWKAPDEIMRATSIDQNSFSRSAYRAISQFFPQDARRLVETGSGSGKNLIAWASAHPGTELVGIDVSEQAISTAGKGAKARDIKNVHFIKGDIRDEPFADGQFDVVFSEGVIEHFDTRDMRQIISETVRITKPGGSVVISVPNYYCPSLMFAMWLNGIDWRDVRKNGAYNKWRYGYEQPQKPQDLVRMFMELGMTDIKLDGYEPLYGLEAYRWDAENRRAVYPFYRPALQLIKTVLDPIIGWVDSWTNRSFSRHFGYEFVIRGIKPDFEAYAAPEWIAKKNTLRSVFFRLMHLSEKNSFEPVPVYVSLSSRDPLFKFLDINPGQWIYVTATHLEKIVRNESLAQSNGFELLERVFASDKLGPFYDIEKTIFRDESGSVTTGYVITRSFAARLARVKEPVQIPFDIKNEPYLWGGREFIPKLLGIENSEDRPYAEVWYQDGLDYLFKILDAKDMLSIQVHPNSEQAKEGFAREEKAQPAIPKDKRNYKNATAKPEAHVVISEDFWMLHGFRSLDEIERTFSSKEAFREMMKLESFKAKVGDFRSRSVQAGTNSQKRQALLKDLYEYVMKMDQTEVNQILNKLFEGLPQSEEALDKNSADFWAVRAARTFKNGENRDRGIFSIYLLNLVHLKHGQSTYQEAGILHAYLEGTTAEIMTKSDNVIRAGLTIKHIDTDELLKVVNFKESKPQILSGKKVVDAPTETVYRTPFSEFELSRIDISKTATHRNSRTHGKELLVALGPAKLIAGGKAYDLKPLEGWVVPKGVPYEIRSDKETVIFKSKVPVADSIFSFHNSFRWSRPLLLFSASMIPFAAVLGFFSRSIVPALPFILLGLLGASTVVIYYFPFCLGAKSIELYDSAHAAYARFRSVPGELIRKAGEFLQATVTSSRGARLTKRQSAFRFLGTAVLLGAIAVFGFFGLQGMRNYFDNQIVPRAYPLNVHVRSGDVIQIILNKPFHQEPSAKLIMTSGLSKNASLLYLWDTRWKIDIDQGLAGDIDSLYLDLDAKDQNAIQKVYAETYQKPDGARLAESGRLSKEETEYVNALEAYNKASYIEDIGFTQIRSIPFSVQKRLEKATQSYARWVVFKQYIRPDQIEEKICELFTKRSITDSLKQRESERLRGLIWKNETRLRHLVKIVLLLVAGGAMFAVVGSLFSLLVWLTRGYPPSEASLLKIGGLIFLADVWVYYSTPLILVRKQTLGDKEHLERSKDRPAARLSGGGIPADWKAFTDASEWKRRALELGVKAESVTDPDRQIHDLFEKFFRRAINHDHFVRIHSPWDQAYAPGRMFFRYVEGENRIFFATTRMKEEHLFIVLGKEGSIHESVIADFEKERYFDVAISPERMEHLIIDASDQVDPGLAELGRRFLQYFKKTGRFQISVFFDAKPASLVFTPGRNGDASTVLKPGDNAFTIPVNGHFTPSGRPLIFIADDGEERVRAYFKILNEIVNGTEVVGVNNFNDLETALRSVPFAARRQIKAILLPSWSLPGGEQTGRDIVQIFNQSQEYGSFKNIPVVLITRHTDDYFLSEFIKEINRRSYTFLGVVSIDAYFGSNLKGILRMVPGIPLKKAAPARRGGRLSEKVSWGTHGLLTRQDEMSDLQAFRKTAADEHESEGNRKAAEDAIIRILMRYDESRNFWKRRVRFNEPVIVKFEELVTVIGEYAFLIPRLERKFEYRLSYGGVIHENGWTVRFPLTARILFKMIWTANEMGLGEAVLQNLIYKNGIEPGDRYLLYAKDNRVVIRSFDPKRFTSDGQGRGARLADRKRTEKFFMGEKRPVEIGVHDIEEKQIVSFAKPVIKGGFFATIESDKTDALAQLKSDPETQNAILGFMPKGNMGLAEKIALAGKAAEVGADVILLLGDFRQYGPVIKALKKSYPEVVIFLEVAITKNEPARSIQTSIHQAKENGADAVLLKSYRKKIDGKHWEQQISAGTLAEIAKANSDTLIGIGGGVLEENLGEILSESMPRNVVAFVGLKEDNLEAFEKRVEGYRRIAAESLAARLASFDQTNTAIQSSNGAFDSSNFSTDDAYIEASWPQFREYLSKRTKDEHGFVIRYAALSGIKATITRHIISGWRSQATLEEKRQFYIGYKKFLRFEKQWQAFCQALRNSDRGFATEIGAQGGKRRKYLRHEIANQHFTPDFAEQLKWLSYYWAARNGRSAWRRFLPKFEEALKRTPRLSKRVAIRSGVSRNHILRIAKDKTMPYLERRMRIYQAYMQEDRWTAFMEFLQSRIPDQAFLRALVSFSEIGEQEIEQLILSPNSSELISRIKIRKGYEKTLLLPLSFSKTPFLQDFFQRVSNNKDWKKRGFIGTRELIQELREWSLTQSGHYQDESSWFLSHLTTEEGHFAPGVGIRVGEKFYGSYSKEKIPFKALLKAQLVFEPALLLQPEFSIDPSVLVGARAAENKTELHVTKFLGVKAAEENVGATPRVARTGPTRAKTSFAPTEVINSSAGARMATAEEIVDSLYDKTKDRLHRLKEILEQMKHIVATRESNEGANWEGLAALQAEIVDKTTNQDFWEIVKKTSQMAGNQNLPVLQQNIMHYYGGFLGPLLGDTILFEKIKERNSSLFGSKLVPDRLIERQEWVDKLEELLISKDIIPREERQATGSRLSFREKEAHFLRSKIASPGLVQAGARLAMTGEAREVGARLAAANRVKTKSIYPIFIAGLLAILTLFPATSAEAGTQTNYQITQVTDLKNFEQGSLLADGAAQKKNINRSEKEIRTASPALKMAVSSSIPANTRPTFTVPLSLLQNKKGELNLADIRSTVHFLNKNFSKVPFQIVITSDKDVRARMSLEGLSNGNVQIRVVATGQAPMMSSVWDNVKDLSPSHLYFASEMQALMADPELLGYSGRYSYMPKATADQTRLFAVQEDSGFDFSLLFFIASGLETDRLIVVSKYGSFARTQAVNGFDLFVISTRWAKTLQDLLLSEKESAISA